MVQSAQFYFLAFLFLLESQPTSFSIIPLSWCYRLLGWTIRIDTRIFLGATPANRDDPYCFHGSHGDPALIPHLSINGFPKARTPFHHRHQAPFDRGRRPHSNPFDRGKPRQHHRFLYYPSKESKGKRIAWFGPFIRLISVVDSPDYKDQAKTTQPWKTPKDTVTVPYSFPRCQQRTLRRLIIASLPSPAVTIISLPSPAVIRNRLKSFFYKQRIVVINLCRRRHNPFLDRGEHIIEAAWVCISHYPSVFAAILTMPRKQTTPKRGQPEPKPKKGTRDTRHSSLLTSRSPVTNQPHARQGQGSPARKSQKHLHLATPENPIPDVCLSPIAPTLEPDNMEAELHASPGLDRQEEDHNLSVLFDPPDLRHGFDPTRDPMITDGDVLKEAQLTTTPGDASIPSTHYQKSKSVMFTPGTPYGPRKQDDAQSNQAQSREILYCTVKITAEGKSLDSLTLRLTQLLTGLQNLNIDFQLLGYDQAENMPTVTKVTSLGTKMTQFQRYFHGLYLAKTTWSQWRVSWIPPHLGYTHTQFLTDANAVFSEFDSSIYAKWLQLPFTATAGWIFKSLEHTDLLTLKLFLETELANHYNFSGPFALYRKVPFTGQVLPPHKQATSVQASGRAIHVDTADSLATTLWQHLHKLLKSKAMKKFHNFEWKFIPQFHSRRSNTDQLHLKTTAAKQKLVYNAIATVTCDFYLDIESPMNEDGFTLRRFFLDQCLPGQSVPLVLAIDRADKNGDEYIFTAAKENHESLGSLIHFSPIILFREVGNDVKRKLSIQGLAALEDQYWDDQLNLPRSKFSDSLRDDHMDDRDIRIVIENLPESLLGVKRPGDTAGLDLDDITQPSFTTQGACKAKHPRFEAPRDPTNSGVVDSDYVTKLEQEKMLQNQKIAALEAQLAKLLSSNFQSPPAASMPMTQLDDSI